MLSKILSTIAVAGAAMAAPTIERRTLPYGQVITSCTVAGKIALTFDDGPYIYTQSAAQQLHDAGMKATFFFNGENWSNIYDNAAIVTSVKSLGHQIGSHTWAHADLASSSTDVKSQMTLLEDAFVSILGVRPKYLRPPYLSTNDAALAILKDLEYVVVSIDTDTLDYSLQDNIAQAEANFDNGVAAGGLLVLAHDVHEKTVTDLIPHMISKINALGLTAVTVGECLGDPEANWYGPARSATTSTSSTKTSTSTSSTKTSTSTSSTKTSTSVSTTSTSSTKTSTSTTATSTSTTKTSTSTTATSTSTTSTKSVVNTSTTSSIKPTTTTVASTSTNSTVTSTKPAVTTSSLNTVSTKPVVTVTSSAPILVTPTKVSTTSLVTVTPTLISPTLITTSTVSNNATNSTTTTATSVKPTLTLTTLTGSATTTSVKPTVTSTGTATSTQSTVIVTPTLITVTKPTSTTTAPTTAPTTTSTKPTTTATPTSTKPTTTATPTSTKPTTTATPTSTKAATTATPTSTKAATTTTTKPTSTTTTKAPTSTGYPVSTDWSCGPDNGNTRCADGYCCSQYGWCGDTREYCKRGCQKLFGQCW